MIHIPAKEERTMEWCKKVVDFNGDLLFYVPVENRTKEVCDIAVRNTGRALCYVPMELRTEDMCWRACSGHFPWQYVLSAVPSNLRAKLECGLTAGLRTVM